MDRKYMIEVECENAKEYEEFEGKRIKKEVETHHYRPPTIEEAKKFDKEGVAQFNAMQDKLRESSYKKETDGLFFKEQRGEIKKGTYAKKVEEIKKRFPKIEV